MSTTDTHRTDDDRRNSSGFSLDIRRTDDSRRSVSSGLVSAYEFKPTHEPTNGDMSVTFPVHYFTAVGRAERDYRGSMIVSVHLDDATASRLRAVLDAYDAEARAAGTFA